MSYEGNLEVLSWLKKGEKRIGLFVSPGGAKGVLGGAQMIALNDHGLQERLSVMAGISAGAWTVLYGASGQARTGNSIFYEECCTKEFLSLHPKRILRGTAYDVGMVARLARTGRKAVNLEKVQACAAKLKVGVTDYTTSAFELLDLKEARPDPIEAALASAATPVIYRKPVIVNGSRKIDGFSNPLPVKELVETHGLDGLIVFANRSLHSVLARRKQVVDRVGVSFLPQHHKQPGKERHARFQEGLQYLRREGGVPYLIIWNTETFEMFERQPEVLRRASDRAYQQMMDLIERAG